MRLVPVAQRARVLLDVALAESRSDIESIGASAAFARSAGPCASVTWYWRWLVGRFGEEAIRLALEEPPEDIVTLGGNRFLAIEGATYHLADFSEGRSVVLRLSRVDPGRKAVEPVQCSRERPGDAQCDCPAFVYTPERGCKHLRALSGLGLI